MSGKSPSEGEPPAQVTTPSPIRELVGRGETPSNGDTPGSSVRNVRAGGCPFQHARDSPSVQVKDNVDDFHDYMSMPKTGGCPFMHGSDTMQELNDFRRSLGAELADPHVSSGNVLPNKFTNPFPLRLSAGRSTEKKLKPVSKESKYSCEITYWDYIHPDILTSLQTGREGKGLNHHDEHLFIIVHQTFELWFKQIIFELEYVRDAFSQTTASKKRTDPHPLFRAIQRLRRADSCMRLATQAYDIMETMDPQDFLEFRDFLVPASGFQSTQLREIEILLGLKDVERIRIGGRHYREAFVVDNVDKTSVFDGRLSESSVKDAVYKWLKSIEFSALDTFLAAFLDYKTKLARAKLAEVSIQMKVLENALSNKASDAFEFNYLENLKAKVEFEKVKSQRSVADMRAFFTEKEEGKGRLRTMVLLLFTFHTHPALSQYSRLLSLLLHFEQGVIIWRNRHARMVELFIGRRLGTGGSSGVQYIDKTAQIYRVFADVWKVRSLCAQSTRLGFDFRNYWDKFVVPPPLAIFPLNSNFHIQLSRSASRVENDGESSDKGQLDSDEK